MLIGLLVVALLAFCALALAFTAWVDRLPPPTSPRDVVAASELEGDAALEAGTAIP